MKKTKMHVVIVYIDVNDYGNRDADVWKRAVYEDENGEQFVKLDGCWVELDSLEQDSHITLVYY